MDGPGLRALGAVSCVPRALLQDVFDPVVVALLVGGRALGVAKFLAASLDPSFVSIGQANGLPVDPNLLSACSVRQHGGEGKGCQCPQERAAVDHHGSSPSA